jgi:hypothetical protein
LYLQGDREHHQSETDPELQAALICLLTSALAAKGTAAIIGEAEEGFFWLRSGGRKERLPTNAKLYHATGPLLLRTAGLVFHFLLRICCRRWMVAVVSSHATSQKSESCEEYRCYDFRNCPVCHLLAYEYFILILQSKIGRNRGSKNRPHRRIKVGRTYDRIWGGGGHGRHLHGQTDR